MCNRFLALWVLSGVGGEGPGFRVPMSVAHPGFSMSGLRS